MRHGDVLEAPSALDPVDERERPSIGLADLDEPWDVRPFDVDERERDWAGSERWIG